MATNTNVLLIRHAEKPETGELLAVAGQERAQAYTVYFQNYALDGPPASIKFLFAAADSSESERPRLTLQPLAQVLGLTIDDKHSQKDYQKVADDLLQNSKYDGMDVLVCWHHGEILALASALGVDGASLPPASNWPASWPGDVFGWLLQLRYDASGNLIPAETLCLNQQLMYDDYGRNPPAG
jgi:hypothetical protein